MCGINGIITAKAALKKNILKANYLLKHRGPDDEGYTVINSRNGSHKEYSGIFSAPEIKNKYPAIEFTDNNEEEVILAHRRLSIIDLSINGHCPMSSADGNVWITYNGEIYNYIELRNELQQYGFNFRTNSDTEVIINAYLKWGVNCLNRFNGMWAFAIWDKRTNRLFAARDRFGVKPFYYTVEKDHFAFSSEIKPLVSYMPSAPAINKNRIPFFLLYGNRLNTQDTYLNRINSLKASCYLIYENGKVTIEQYYEINRTADTLNEEQLKSKIVELLSDSIKLRFRSDAPVGTCLSGGFDSSSIVSLSSTLYTGSLETFSAVWQEKNCDESYYIDIVNHTYGCSPNKIIPDVNEFEEVFDDLCYYQELPTEGPGLYPQWYVMKEAGKKVKVLLDGQGGDEVFGGYFQMGAYLRGIIKDRRVLKAAGESKNFLQFLNKSGLHSFSSWLFPRQYNYLTRSKLSAKFDVLNKELAGTLNEDELYFDAEPKKLFGNYLSDLSYHFVRNITIPALLHYEDRSSMAHSIESRVPFLDYRLVELGVNLSANHLSHRGVSRPLYRKALKPKLPEEIVDRKDKLGFPVPFSEWTKGPLKSYIYENLNGNYGLFDYINKTKFDSNLKDHFAGTKDYSWELWRLLSLNNFLKLFSSNEFRN